MIAEYGFFGVDLLVVEVKDFLPKVLGVEKTNPSPAVKVHATDLILGNVVQEITKLLEFSRRSVGAYPSAGRHVLEAVAAHD